MTMKEHVNQQSELAIFGRLLRATDDNLSRELAEYLLTVGFDKADQERMQDLAERNQQGALSEEEHGELLAYVKAGHLVALLHSKARKCLRKQPIS